ncbi:MAG: SWIM zinc finger family protein, partial [Corallincola sp.]|nr:SWIM zinc finger family protein [Corallincola sp.]
MADYNEADIRAQLGAATLTKGEAYANDDRVKALTAQTEGSVLVLRGEVAGSRRYTSVVRVRQVHHRVVFESHCSCPLGGDCKHVAALLLSHLAGSRPDAARRLNEAQRMRQATLIEMWLLQLSQGAKRPPKVGDEVRVLLSRQSYRSWGSPWDLTLMKSTRHKNGQGISFKVLRSPDFNALRSSYPHLAPMLTAFAGEQRSQSGYGGTLQLQGVGGLVVLHGAISAGACHLDDIDSPPLTLGDSRRVTPRWQENDDGSQQLVVGEPHWLLLPVEPLHAVDPLSGSCFMVDSGLPGLTSAALAKAPLIPQELADKVAETVASHLPRLPLPRSRMAEARRDLLPQPLLRIGNLDPSQPHLEGITLWFRYGQQLVSSDDHCPH